MIEIKDKLSIAFSLNKYESEVLAVVIKLKSCTVREVKKKSDVPNSRIYDIAVSLSKKGLIEIEEKEGEKLRYKAFSNDKMIKNFNKLILDEADKRVRRVEEIWKNQPRTN